MNWNASWGKSGVKKNDFMAISYGRVGLANVPASMSAGVHRADSSMDTSEQVVPPLALCPLAAGAGSSDHAHRPGVIIQLV